MVPTIPIVLHACIWSIYEENLGCKTLGNDFVIVDGQDPELILLMVVWLSLRVSDKI